MQLRLVPEEIYRRTELHAQFGGQRQGGISTPANSPVVLLFTGSPGVQHGYHDGWSHGVFCYFGEGQVGDMQWVRGNAAIRDHATLGRDILLFEMLDEPRSHVKYLGAFAAASWEYRQTPDTNGVMRRAIAFHLVPVATDLSLDAPATADDGRLVEQTDEKELGSDAPHRTVRQALVTYIQRSAQVRDHALRRAGGNCERCGQAAPFKTESGIPFLEVHHIRRLTDGGPDRVDAVAALCPNCHREAHYGTGMANLNAQLLATVAEKERDGLPEPKLPRASQ